ncbi:unnamed protein product [Darwinula stevensoni]|uniref:Uncharacterized protein n=1 Tax=Darwinula stevensoni TaxID=69355 RepID=A0A7R9FRE8_9CRUS|nr:unnamed protein product [Darwinula stevensoni]CAG0901185.1 unnamed protein product [Darwinula stevensoni]
MKEYSKLSGKDVDWVNCACCWLTTSLDLEEPELEGPVEAAKETEAVRPIPRPLSVGRILEAVRPCKDGEGKLESLLCLSLGSLGSWSEPAGGGHDTTKTSVGLTISASQLLHAGLLHRGLGCGLRTSLPAYVKEEGHRDYMYQMLPLHSSSTGKLSKRETITGLHKSGNSVAECVRPFGTPRSSIYKAVKHFKELVISLDYPRSGHPATVHVPTAEISRQEGNYDSMKILLSSDAK